MNVARPDMARLILLTLRLVSHIVVEISPSGKSAMVLILGSSPIFKNISISS
jgi:hypothetical protein